MTRRPDNPVEPPGREKEDRTSNSRLPLLTVRGGILWTAVMTLLMEGIMVLFRFGFGLTSSRTGGAVLSPLTGGIRIHHGFVGAILVIVALWLYRRRTNLARWILVLALALILSDLLHHFAVLLPVTGDSDFYFTYDIAP